MLLELFITLALLLALASLISLPEGLSTPDPLKQQGLLGLVSLTLTLLVLLWPQATPESSLRPDGPLGHAAGFEYGLQARALLPLQYRPGPAWLKQTRGQRQILARPIGVFADPTHYAFRRQGVKRYFEWRYALPQALETDFSPSLIVLHSTEGTHEAHVYALFNRNTAQQYLGGTWTHFSIDPQGQIRQYGPLNRISKGQAGIDDQAVGIELVGTASLWSAKGQQQKTGSIIQRWQQGDTRQLHSALDLIQTLQALYQIPTPYIFAHEDLGHLAERLTPGPRWPDTPGLAARIRDQVWLGLKPDLGPDYQPTRRYRLLENYDRQDPGRDVMALLYSHLRGGKAPKNW